MKPYFYLYLLCTYRYDSLQRGGIIKSRMVGGEGDHVDKGRGGGGYSKRGALLEKKIKFK